MLAELIRVTRPGGTLHLIPEDYGMLHFQRGVARSAGLLARGSGAIRRRDRNRLFIGRNVFGILAAMNLEAITVDYVVVDTVRVPRETFASILEAWRDGYVEPIGELTPITRDQALAYFDQMIADIRDPQRYAVWMVPVVSARVPAVARD